MDEELTPLESKSQATTPSPYLVPGAIIVAGLLIAATIFYTKSGSSPKTTPAAVAGSQALLANIADDDPFLGNPEAPITLVEFGDFQCPFCGKFFSETESQIIDRYVKTGRIKFVYRDYAFLGRESEDAAVAAECAKEQGKFWEFHNYLYSHQRGENGGAFSKTNLKNFARELNLETGPFDSCLDSNQYLSEIRQDKSDGTKLGVNGTPAVFINGRLVPGGAAPFDDFAAVIEEELTNNK